MKSKCFKIEELVHPDTLERLGEDDCWKLFDSRAIETLDYLKSQPGFKGILFYVNTWMWGGIKEDNFKIYDDRGYRDTNSDTGSSTSRHRFGMAFDIWFVGTTAEKVRKWIKGNKDKLPHSIRIEGKVSWLHFDVDAKQGYKVYEFKV